MYVTISYIILISVPTICVLFLKPGKYLEISRICKIGVLHKIEFINGIDLGVGREEVRGRSPMMGVRVR